MVCVFAAFAAAWAPPASAMSAPQLFWANNRTNAIGAADFNVNESLTATKTQPRMIAADAHHIYWTNYNSIGRANLDGSDVNQDFIPNVFQPEGIAVDAQHVYWASASYGIGRANLDGSDVNPTFIPAGAVGIPWAVAVSGQYIYFSDRNNILRAKLDGTGVSTLVSGVDAFSLAVDQQHVYWANFNADTIGEADLDGTNVDNSFVTGGNRLMGVASDGTDVFFTNEGDAASGGAIGQTDAAGIRHVDQSLITGTGQPDGIAIQGKRIYWVNTTGSIGTARFSQDLMPANGPVGLAVDSQHIYWATSGATIDEASRSGTTSPTSLITDAHSPVGVAVDARHIYWTDSASDTIGEANLDGTAETTLVTGAGEPQGIAVDGQHVYWANYATNTIGRANLDGTGVDESFIQNASGPEGVAVDQQHVYWVNRTTDAIGEANLDGTSPNQAFIGGAGDLIKGPNDPYGLAVDGTYVYWSSLAHDTIGRANIDGTGVDESFISGAALPTGVAVSSADEDLDTTPPSISASHAADGRNGWNVGSPVTETVSASDSGSGLAGAPGCTVDGDGATLTDNGDGTWTFPVSGEGTHSVSCSASDNAGNQNSASDAVNIDSTPPAIKVSHVADGQNGWNVSSPVTETVSASDAGSGLAGAPGCTVDGEGATLTDNGDGTWTFPVSGEGTHSVSCSASDRAGNQNTTDDSAKVDTKPPLVSYAGNAGSYTIADSVNITCSSSDPAPGSGVASDTCKNITGPAYTFALGSNGYAASATDNAGNTGKGATSFTVRVDPASLFTLTMRFIRSSVASSLCAQLAAAKASIARGNWNSANGQLKAYRSLLAAQSGKNITADQASLLSRLSQAI
jgi:hypothetical protein